MVMLSTPKKLTKSPVRFLIEEACIIMRNGDKALSPAAIGEEVEIPQDQAFQLAGFGRGYFLSPDADPTEGKLFTALAEDKARIACKVAQHEQGMREREARSAPAAAVAMSAQTMAVAVAEAVTHALATHESRKAQGKLL